MKSARVTITLILLAVGVAIGFQNCDRHGFSVAKSNLLPPPSVSAMASHFVSMSSDGYDNSPALDLGEGYDVIVIAGQSNSVGYGCGPVTDVSTASDSRIFQMTPSGAVSAAVEPLTQANGVVGGKGFAMTFARLYASRMAPNRKVLLVPAGVGSTSILKWDNTYPDVLYSTMVQQVRQALASGNPADNRLVALLWHQGENDFAYIADTNDPNHANMSSVSVYKAHLKQFMQTVRTEFRNSQLPIVMGEIGAFWADGAGANGQRILTDINMSIRDVATEIGYAGVVSSSGLNSGRAVNCSFSNFPGGDPYHFSAASQVEMGRRYHQIFLFSTSNGPGATPAPPTSSDPNVDFSDRDMQNYWPRQPQSNMLIKEFYVVNSAGGAYPSIIQRHGTLSNGDFSLEDYNSQNMNQLVWLDTWNYRLASGAVVETADQTPIGNLVLQNPIVWGGVMRPGREVLSFPVANSGSSASDYGYQYVKLEHSLLSYSQMGLRLQNVAVLLIQQVWCANFDCSAKNIYNMRYFMAPGIGIIRIDFFNSEWAYIGSHHVGRYCYGPSTQYTCAAGI